MSKISYSEQRLESARELLSDSPRVAAFSGAGLSAESGLSTFRDPEEDGLWSQFDPTALASIEGFEANPQRVIEWYAWRRSQLAAVEPNPAHRALAAQQGMMQITQNVDHLLEQAGASPERILHLHGSILIDRCHSSACDYQETIDLDHPPELRACPECADTLRPAVVWFGEGLPQDTWQLAQQLCMHLDCLLVIGTSASVYPAAGLIALAMQHGSRIIVVDPNPGAAGDLAEIFLQGNAAEVLPTLLQGLELSSDS